MEIRTVALATTLVLYSLNPIFAYLQGQSASGPKPAEQMGPASIPIPFEIRGDFIGEALTEFSARHPNATCSGKKAEIQDCYERTDVKLAELATMSSGCNPPADAYWTGVCGTEGMVATFSKNRLSELTYRFYVDEVVSYPQSNILQICRAFTAKYGKPGEGNGINNCNWDSKNKEGQIEQFILVTTQHFKIAGKETAFTTIMLEAIPPPSKNI